MYDSMAAARATAQDFPVLGAYIAAVDIDHVDSRLVVARQTLRPGHYTVWAAPEALRAAVVAVAPA